MDIIMAGIDSYFLNKPIDYSKFLDYNLSYHAKWPYYHLLKQQECIGWDHLLRGKLSHYWTLLQEDFVWSISPGTKFDQGAWLCFIIGPPIQPPPAKTSGQFKTRNAIEKMIKKRKVSRQLKLNGTHMGYTFCNPKSSMVTETFSETSWMIT
jgi:hypothetical protein